MHVISIQNVQDSSSIIYWSFCSCIKPSDYITYHMNKSVSNSNTSSPLQSNSDIPSDDGKVDIPILFNPIHGK